MEIGDCFFDGKDFIFVIKEGHYRLKECEVYEFETGRYIGYTSERVGTILNMRKLTPLEKELM
jgi:hypothetical protein